MNQVMTRSLTWISRVGVGATFIFSGFTKGIDPYGTLYKLRDYLTAVSIDLPDPFLLVVSFTLFLTEFLLGLFILLGCYRKIAPRLVALIMLFMLALTLWIAIANPVADCGCFGDALILSNWATFFKNVVLTLMAIWLVRFNTSVFSLIAPAVQWLAFVGGGCYLAIISFIGYRIQPIIDFRPFPSGSHIVLDEVAEDNEQYSFIYRRGNEEMRVEANDELPEESEGWTFERRELIPGQENRNQKESSFRIFDEDGDEDITTDLIDSDSTTLLVCMPEPAKVSKGDIWRIEELLAEAEEEDIDGVIVAGGGDMTILNIWKENLSDRFPIYQAEDTSIKMLVRGNPGIVILHGDSIVMKGTLSSIPLRSLMKERGIDSTGYEIKDFSFPLHKWLNLLSIGLGIWILVLIIGSALGWFIRGGMVHHVESSSLDKSVQ